MTKKQIEAIHWAVRSWEESIHQDESALERNPQLPRRMKEADEALTALHAEPHQEPWLDAKIRMSDAAACLDMAARFAERAGASLLIRNGIREIRERAISIRNLMAFPEQQPGAAADPAPESGLRKRHLEAIREVYRVARDAWYGPARAMGDASALGEKYSRPHSQDEASGIEGILNNADEAITIMEKEGLGFIS